MPRHPLYNVKPGRTAFIAGASVLAVSQLVFVFTPARSAKREQEMSKGRDGGIKSNFPILHRVPSSHIPGTGVPRL